MIFGVPWFIEALPQSRLMFTWRVFLFGFGFGFFCVYNYLEKSLLFLRIPVMWD